LAAKAEDDSVADAEAETGGESADKLAAQARIIKAVLEKVRPLQKGFTCGILVRKNKNAQAVAQWLRAHGVPQVMVEGVATLAEQSPVVAAVVDALRWLATPANELAEGHIGLTPLWDVLAQPLRKTEAVNVPANKVWTHWRRRIADIGAPQVTAEWCAALAITHREPYAQYCLLQVSQAAQQAGAALTLPDWSAALEQLAVRETAATGSIHVMTIHKAKGLGFDVVFLPDLDLGGGGRDEILIRRDEQGCAMACLSYPPKWLQAWEPALGNLSAAQKADQDLEGLCVLYVALTRAKEATFVILNKEKPRMASAARDWILSAIGKSSDAPADPPAENPWGEGELQWEHGSRDLGVGKKDAQTSIVLTRPPVQLPAPVPRRKRRKPSEAGHAVFAQASPAADSRGGQEFGTAVHEVFEQIEWWTPDQPLEGAEEAVALVRKCMVVPEILALFARQSERDEALRELPVEFMEEGTWWSGIVDRLVLRRDADSTLRQAVLLDFKTDSVANAAILRDRYAEQLTIYRRAISNALKLGADRVEAIFLSTHLEAVLQL
jgi:ATP-dependent helicase/nuclease subunit A